MALVKQVADNGTHTCTGHYIVPIRHKQYEITVQPNLGRTAVQLVLGDTYFGCHSRKSSE